MKERNKRKRKKVLNFLDLHFDTTFCVLGEILDVEREFDKKSKYQNTLKKKLL
jgi:hypothetical protein